MLPKFLALLDHKDVEVRAAAGENVAFLYECAQNCGVSLPYDEEILGRFLTMSKDNSKKNSKKDRKTQRSVFRDIYSTLAVRFESCNVPYIVNMIAADSSVSFVTGRLAKPRTYLLR